MLRGFETRMTTLASNVLLDPEGIEATCGEPFRDLFDAQPISYEISGSRTSEIGCHRQHAPRRWWR